MKIKVDSKKGFWKILFKSNELTKEEKSYLVSKVVGVVTKLVMFGIIILWYNNREYEFLALFLGWRMLGVFEYWTKCLDKVLEKKWGIK